MKGRRKEAKKEGMRRRDIQVTGERKERGREEGKGSERERRVDEEERYS